jgi:serine/threonine-protein kinase
MGHLLLKCRNNKAKKVELMKSKAFIISLLIFIILFFIGIVIANALMRYIVRYQKEVDVPALVGLHYDEAKDLCIEKKLYIAIADYEYNEMPKNIIISQKPYSGKKTYENRTIYVMLSLGEKKVIVPDLTGMHINDIENELKKHGLGLSETEYEYSDTVEQNHVIYTSPPSGAPLMEGKTVKVIISAGRKSYQDNSDNNYQYDPSTDDYIY